MTDNSPTKLLVIDNYDSFTYNLVHLIGAIPGLEMEVVRKRQNHHRRDCRQST